MKYLIGFLLCGCSYTTYVYTPVVHDTVIIYQNPFKWGGTSPTIQPDMDWHVNRDDMPNFILPYPYSLDSIKFYNKK